MRHYEKTAYPFVVAMLGIIASYSCVFFLDKPGSGVLVGLASLLILLWSGGTAQ